MIWRPIFQSRFLYFPGTITTGRRRLASNCMWPSHDMLLFAKLLPSRRLVSRGRTSNTNRIKGGHHQRQQQKQTRGNGSNFSLCTGSTVRFIVINLFIRKSRHRFIGHPRGRPAKWLTLLVQWQLTCTSAEGVEWGADWIAYSDNNNMIGNNSARLSMGFCFHCATSVSPPHYKE